MRGHLSHLTVAARIQRQLVQPPILSLLLLTIVPDEPLIAPRRRHEIPRAQKCCPTQFRDRPANSRAMWIARFPLRYSIACTTEYFGGIDTNIWTWSGSRCPLRIVMKSTIRKKRFIYTKFKTI